MSLLVPCYKLVLQTTTSSPCGPLIIMLKPQSPSFRFLDELSSFLPQCLCTSCFLCIGWCQPSNAVTGSLAPFRSCLIIFLMSQRTFLTTLFFFFKVHASCPTFSMLYLFLSFRVLTTICNCLMCFFVCASPDSFTRWKTPSGQGWCQCGSHIYSHYLWIGKCLINICWWLNKHSSLKRNVVCIYSLPPSFLQN